MVMKLEDDLLKKMRALPIEKQRKVIDFIDRLQEDASRKKKGKSLAGLWSKYHIDISEEEFKELRREMWANFPRDI